MALKTKWVGREQLLKRLSAIAPEVEGRLATAQLEAAEDLAGKIRSYAPVNTGEYRASIHADRLSNRPDAVPHGAKRTTDPGAAGVFAAWYWHWIEFGTRPHTISAKGAPLMVFEGKEGRKAALTVNHPGSPPQPHFLSVFRAEKKNMRRRFARVVNSAVKKAMAK